MTGKKSESILRVNVNNLKKGLVKMRTPGPDTTAKKAEPSAYREELTPFPFLVYAEPGKKCQ